MNRVRLDGNHADELRFSLRDLCLFLAGVTAIVGTIAAAWWRMENRMTTVEVGHGGRLTTIEANQDRQADKLDRITELLGGDRHAEFRRIPKREIHE